MLMPRYITNVKTQLQNGFYICPVLLQTHVHLYMHCYYLATLMSVTCQMAMYVCSIL